ncbi:MAG: hypothetical protein FJ294_15175, partial [Planctomycetes bacterium]|nr:hypothetical protein [Planctomycetota bacterium]
MSKIRGREPRVVAPPAREQGGSADPRPRRHSRRARCAANRRTGRASGRLAGLARLLAPLRNRTLVAGAGSASVDPADPGVPTFSSSTSMTHPALIERITRSLAYMLRHQPEKFDLELDKEGFGEFERVVRALGERLGEAVEPADVMAAVEGGDRPRYELRGDRIRALYGHSIPVEPGEPSQPPEFLYVGIDARDLDRAKQYGLRGGRRRFLHLALSAEDAREAGRRAAQEYAILQVFSMDAWEEGVNFYDRRTLYLCEQIPTQYLQVLEQGDDGYEPRPDIGERGDGPSRRREERGGRNDRGGRRSHGDDRAPRQEDRAPREEGYERRA